MKRVSHFQTRARRSSGSALLLVLWCLVIMAIAVFGVVELAELSVESASQEQLAIEARALASTGLALGLSPQITKDDPLLQQHPAAGRRFQVRIESEGSRLNLNYILLTNHREILSNLFTQWGLQMADADHVVDCLYDWITPGDLPSLEGAKAADYAKAGLPQRPTYQQFTSLDEVRLVMGMDLLEKVRPNWRDSFTLWSSGPLDVSEAPPDLIAAVFSLNPERVATFTDARNGRDHLAGTSDDVPIPSLDSFQASLGIASDTMKLLGPQVALSDNARRIESVGQAQGVRVMISVVTRLNTTPVQYLLWSEQ